jgi:hypothetical protein
MYPTSGQPSPKQQQTVDVATGFSGFGLLLSLYWTMQVIKNVGHVTTAGEPGTVLLALLLVRIGV